MTILAVPAKKRIGIGESRGEERENDKDCKNRRYKRREQRGGGENDRCREEGGGRRGGNGGEMSRGRSIGRKAAMS